MRSAGGRATERHPASRGETDRAGRPTMALTESPTAFATALARAAAPTAAPTLADAQALWTMWTQIRPMVHDVAQCAYVEQQLQQMLRAVRSGDVIGARLAVVPLHHWYVTSAR